MNRKNTFDSSRSSWLILVFVALGSFACSSEQQLDPSFEAVQNTAPTYDTGSGPTIWIDEAHNNIVATVGRYEPFVAVLEADGYVVRPLRTKFTRRNLDEVRLLVIGNALSDKNLEAWKILENGQLPAIPTPTHSGFGKKEIETVYEWVYAGGGLLLLADHMPFAGAAKLLAKRFGFSFYDGFAIDPETWDPLVFQKADGTIESHAITENLAGVGIERVATFDGQAFLADEAEALMRLGPGVALYQPAIPWDFETSSPHTSVAGWLQGAVVQVGSGRIAVFGDATMFSAQLRQDGSRMGMNTEEGKHNAEFLLSIMRWLFQAETQ